MKNILQISGMVCLLLVIITFIFIINKPSEGEKEDILEVSTIIKNHQFNPSIIEVPKGKKICLVIHNQDSTVEEFESHDLHREKIIMPNNFIRIIIAPLAPGKYDFFGDFHQETAQGSLIVN